MRTVLLALIIAALLALAVGCGSTWDSTSDMAVSAWNSTRDLVNPPPEIDTERYHFDNPNQEKLALLFTPVDGPFSSLVRYLEDQDIYPSRPWIDLLFTRFPWIHNLIITDRDGTVLERLPTMPMKWFEEPLVFTARWREVFLKTVVDYPELGPELYIGTPYYSDVDLAGLIVVSFDPRTLFDFCPDPEELIIIQPGGGVWTMGAEVDEEGLLAIDWQSILEDDVGGQVDVGGKYYTWLARYVGTDVYIYATESVDPQWSDSWWF